MKKNKLTQKQKLDELKHQLKLKQIREKETERHLKQQAEIDSLKFHASFTKEHLKNKKLRDLLTQTTTKTKKLLNHT